MAPATPTSTSQGTTDATALTQIRQMLEQTNARIMQLEQENTNLRIAANNQHKAKMETPAKYDGEKGTLSGWLVQMRAYLLYYQERFINEAQKVGFAASRLEGKALRWFEPTLKDYLDHSDDDEREDFTTEVFAAYSKFEEEIKKVFGETDEKLHAQERLANLTQRKSASAYATQFRQDSLRAEINEEGLMQLFYDGLKEEVKDELYKQERPETLDEYIAMAIRVDDRLYARKQQRKKQNPTTTTFVRANDKKRRQYRSTAHGTHSGAMDVDATQAQWAGGRKGPQGDKREVTCFNCGRKGHYKRDCRSARKDWGPVPGKEVANIDKRGARVIEIAAASYTQDDFEDAADRQLRAEEAEAENVPTEDEEREAATAHPILDDSQEGDSDGERSSGSPGRLYETDDDGDIAPPIWALSSARQWGLTLIQEEDGTWRTTNEGETPGPSTTYLKRRVMELRNEAVKLLRQERDLRGELQNEERQKEATLIRLRHEKEQREQVEKGIQDVRQLAVEVAVAVREGRLSTEGAQREVSRLRVDAADLATLAEHGGNPWDGPTEEQHTEEPRICVLNPEHDYQSYLSTLEEGQEPPTWEEYWEGEVYTIQGRCTNDLEWVGYGDRFRLLEGDDARLHPRRKDHMQVPWFQCLAHECRYHFKDKIDHDCWPIREQNQAGENQPLTWTYDHGLGAADHLWKIYEDGQRLRAVPRQAWPTKCQGRSENASYCPSKDCIRHANAKLEYYAQVNQPRVSNQLVGTRRRRLRNQRKEEEEASRSSVQWLQEHETIDAASQGADRDALKHQQDLGNDSGPSKGPDDL